MMYGKGPMHQLLNSRRMLIAMTMIVVLVAVVFPTCRMIGCSMEMGPNGAMPISMHQLAMGDMFRITGDCGGEYVTSETFDGLVPTGVEALLLALMAALVGGIVFMAPRVRFEASRLAYATPPPPPLEPRGERFLI